MVGWVDRDGNYVACIGFPQHESRLEEVGAWAVRFELADFAFEDRWPSFFVTDVEGGVEIAFFVGGEALECHTLFFWQCNRFAEAAVGLEDLDAIPFAGFLVLVLADENGTVNRTCSDHVPVALRTQLATRRASHAGLASATRLAHLEFPTLVRGEDVARRVHLHSEVAIVGT